MNAFTIAGRPRGGRLRSSLGAARLVAALALGIGSLAPAHPAFAAIAPDAQAVLDRYVAAIGGRASVESMRTSHMTGVIRAFSLDGTIEIWGAAPDRRAAKLELGPFKLLDGWDGTRAWRTDPGGKVLLLDGKDLAEARASAWFESERWLAPDQGGGSVTAKGTDQDSLGSYDVLEVTPPAGRPRTLAFDRTTGLLARSVSKDDTRTVVARVSDWRDVSGRKVPFKTAQEVVGMPMNTLVVTLQTARINEEFDLAVFAPPAAGGETKPTYLKTPGVAQLPFEYSARHVWLRASVNGGPPADFLYDTGASITVLDSAYAAKIGVKPEGKMQGEGAGSAGTGALGRIESLRIEGPDGDGVEMKDLKIAVLDVNSVLAPFFWRDCAGVIGFDVINRFVNTVDYDAPRLTLRDPATFRYEGNGSKVPFTLSNHVPVATFKLDGRYEGEFRLDVGSGSTVDLHGPFVKRHRLDSLVTPTVPILGGGFGGTFSSRLGRMTRMEVGPFAWTRPLVVLSGAAGGALTSEDYAGNVGNSILERFRVTLDYERRELWLEPGERYARPDHFSRLGMQLARRNGRIEVGQVLERSPAARAGFQTGDEVLRVNGRPPVEWGLDGLSHYLEESAIGTKVTIEYARAGKTKKKSVKLAEVI